MVSRSNMAKGGTKHGKKLRVIVTKGRSNIYKGRDFGHNTQQNGRLEILVMLYSDQPFKPNLPVLCRQRKQDFIFYFIILYKCTLQPAACMENGLKGLKGWCHWELKCRILL